MTRARARVTAFVERLVPGPSFARTKELEERGATALARAAHARLRVADELAEDAATRPGAWPLYRDAARLAEEALAAAGEPAAAPDLDGDDAALEGSLPPLEARARAERFGALVRASLAPVDPRTRGERVFEAALRLVTGAAVVGLVAFAGWWAAFGPKNLARGATVTSSVTPPGEPSPLVDGVFEDKTWAFTNFEPNAQVVVDLGATHRIQKVVVYGRSEREHAEFLPLVLEVSTDGQHYMELGRAEKLFTAYVPWTVRRRVRDVRYVRLRTEHPGRIALSELEVLGR